MTSECEDGKDNDGDALVDRAQDPGCEADDSEAPNDTPALPECGDKVDNDDDGPIDKRDPGCRADGTEAPAGPVPPPPPR